MKKLILITALLSLTAFTALAQQQGGVKGRVISRANKVWIMGAKVKLNTPEPRSTETGYEGVFEFADVPNGVWELTIETTDYLTARVTVQINNTMRDVMISLSPEFSSGGVDESSFAEFDTESAGDDFLNLPVVLSASKDIFDNIASYNFSAMRFRPRGYETSTSDIYFNGILMNDAQSGYTPWSLWGGLNDATRTQESTSALAAGDYGVGSINGTTAISATASQVRQGFRAGLVNSSGQYQLRAMVTYASGLNDKGWAYAFSASTRQGGNNWVNGVYYDAWSYFGSLEKKFCNDHSLALTVFGAPTIRGAQGASTQEVYDLVGSNYYNPNWGYQGGCNDIHGRYSGGGKMRNSRERDSHEPVAVLNYSYDASAKTKIMASVSYRFGYNGYSALDWYDDKDPRPDYYRFLPSYYENEPLKKNYFTDGWKSNWNVRQIDWNRLYNVNYESYFQNDTETNPAVNAMTRRSKYILSDRRADQRDVNAKVQIISVVSEKYKVYGGLEYRWNRTEYFQAVKDLMGGDYYLDIDKYAERDYAGGDTVQSDLNHPNRLVKEGDKYGYDYYGHVRTGKAWGTVRYAHKQWEGYLAAEVGQTQMWRQGLYRKGLFPNDSYGDSEKKNFLTYTGKIGLTYKIDGNNLVWANVAYMADAPYFARAMVSPRTRNEFLPGLSTDKRLSTDLNYSISMNGYRLRVTGYYTTLKDQTEIISFYDDLAGTFTNFAMRGINQMHTGLELGLQVPITKSLNAKAGLNYGYYIYTSNPTVTQTRDNSSEIILDNEPVYWKNYKIDGTPQTAASLGLDYRGDKNLFLGVNVGYYDANYISMNPLRRTDYANQNLTPDLIKQMAKQEMFPSAFLLNANVGKTWYIRKYVLGMNLNINNILNDTSIRSGGYEQMRLKKTSASDDPLTTYAPFDSKYFYVFGTTYYLNVYFRF